MSSKYMLRGRGSQWDRLSGINGIRLYLSISNWLNSEIHLFNSDFLNSAVFPYRQWPSGPFMFIHNLFYRLFHCGFRFIQYIHAFFHNSTSTFFAIFKNKSRSITSIWAFCFLAIISGFEPALLKRIHLSTSKR